MSDLRHLPSVDKLLAQASPLIESHGRSLTTEAIRSVLDEARSLIRAGGIRLEPAELLTRISDRLQEWTSPRPRAVINATGVIIHTNLGRAPLSSEALAAVTTAASSYSDLEYDLERGERGQRMAAVQDLLRRVTGAEAAFVVNNNAGATLLALSGLAAGRGALISRGQLVEIGGGFRVPDVMEQSGAKLIEVGTTNRTHRRDYEMALVTKEVAAIVRAHSSNFRTVGFTTEVSLSELVELANWKNIPLIDDLGSGALLDTAQYGLSLTNRWHRNRWQRARTSDPAQVARVKRTAFADFDSIADGDTLRPLHRQLLGWAADLHETGLCVSHSQYQLHSGYLVENSDMAGFTRQEQLLLAALVRHQRREIPRGFTDKLPTRMHGSLRSTLLCLRFAGILCRSRDDAALPDFRLDGGENAFSADLPADWIESHPF